MKNMATIFALAYAMTQVSCSRPAEQAHHQHKVSRSSLHLTAQLLQPIETGSRALRIRVVAEAHGPDPIVLDMRNFGSVMFDTTNIMDEVWHGYFPESQELVRIEAGAQRILTLTTDRVWDNTDYDFTPDAFDHRTHGTYRMSFAYYVPEDSRADFMTLSRTNIVVFCDATAEL